MSTSSDCPSSNLISTICVLPRIRDRPHPMRSAPWWTGILRCSLSFIFCSLVGRRPGTARRLLKRWWRLELSQALRSAGGWCCDRPSVWATDYRTPEVARHCQAHRRRLWRPLECTVTWAFWLSPGTASAETTTHRLARAAAATPSDGHDASQRKSPETQSRGLPSDSRRPHQRR